VLQACTCAKPPNGLEKMRQNSRLILTGIKRVRAVAMEMQKAAIYGPFNRIHGFAMKGAFRGFSCISI
jgi:hypothetical protein